MAGAGPVPRLTAAQPCPEAESQSAPRCASTRLTGWARWWGLGCPSSAPTASGISGGGGQALSGSRKPHRCHRAASHPREEQVVTGLGADQMGRWSLPERQIPGVAPTSAPSHWLGMQVSAHWLVPQSLHTLPAGPACPVLSLSPPRPLVSDLNPQRWTGGTIRPMARQPSGHTCLASLRVCSTLPGGATVGPPLPPASLALPRQLFCGASGHPSRGAHSLGNWRTTGAGGSRLTGTHAPSLLPEAHWPDGAGRERVGCREERGQGRGERGSWFWEGGRGNPLEGQHLRRC